MVTYLSIITFPGEKSEAAGKALPNLPKLPDFVKPPQIYVTLSNDNGKIKASCKIVPQGSTIKLDAPGAITLQLPEDVNADIQAESEQGSIICDHYITIKPFITQLNPKAWTQFKRNINGTIGSGNAQICLHSASGNSKIAKLTA